MVSKKLILGISASIAAYKSVFLLRLLVQAGHDVRVLMTPMAHDFVGPLTFSTLSKRPVLTDFYEKKTGTWHNHVELGLWADLFLIAPLSANTLAKMAMGMADNLLLTTYLSARCPIVVAPAMDLDMYAHASTQQNLDTLRTQNVDVLESPSGALASGLEGEGRMCAPEVILAHLNTYFNTSLRLLFQGKQVLITAGPSYEALDAVRFIGNRSSGKMGCALALAFAKQGAQVHLVKGPSTQQANHPNIKRTNVESAESMYKACLKIHKHCVLTIFSAAVSDFKPERSFVKKLKKESITNDFSIALTSTPDIAKTLGVQKQAHQRHIGFALESGPGITQAHKKTKAKKFDLTILNSLQDKGAGFEKDTNKVTFIWPDGRCQADTLKPKRTLAIDIVAKAHDLFN